MRIRTSPRVIEHQYPMLRVNKKTEDVWLFCNAAQATLVSSGPESRFITEESRFIIGAHCTSEQLFNETEPYNDVITMSNE